MRRLIGSIAQFMIGFFHPSSGPSSPMNTFRIRAVLFEEGGWWCGQCLEHDIATQAGTLDEVTAELEHALSIHLELDLERGRVPFSHLPPAPQRYFQMYDAFEKANGAKDADPIHAESPIETCVLARFAYPLQVAI